MFKMSWKSTVLLICLVAYTASMEIPSWKYLQEKLHEKIEDIYNDRDEIHKNLEVGKYFKYYLPDVGSFKAVEEGSDSLPSWLSFDAQKKKLQGVPTEHDLIKGLRIAFVRLDRKDSRKTKKLILNIIKNKNTFGCQDSMTIASMIFHADLKDMTSHQRVKILREASHRFEASINDLYLEDGNRMDNGGLLSSSLRIAGPGDNQRRIKGEKPGFTLSWKLLCGMNIEGHHDIGVLRTYTHKEDFSDFSQPVLGWFISSTKASRARRAVGAGATPGVTPTVSVQGTPTLIPSASIDVKPSIKVQVTPTKSVQMLQTSSVVPPVVVTTEPATTSTTTTTTSTTTTTPTTTTTTTTTTEKRTTQQPTTSKPTVNRPPEVVPEHKFEMIEAQEQHATLFEVPVGLFEDDDPISTNLLYKKDTYVTDVPKWIEYREDGRKIFIFPGTENAGEHFFALKAKDSGGLIAQHFFKVLVKKDQVVYDFKFNMTLDMDYDTIANDPVKKVEIINHIATALGYSNANRMKNVQFLKGSVIVVWSDSMYANASSCNNPEFRSTVTRLENIPNMAERMLPYNLVSTGMTSESGCLIQSEPVNEPEESLWERILIPVIVIIIILLIIALILCCVYRRKKKYEPQADKDESYMNQKKPVIFLEEYEEKPDFVALNPLILPNEKPPVRGGSPDGPESSTSASTEDDENAPLAPKSPKENRSGYNAPPPYSAR